jgi:RNA polymerase sigma-70 factor (ECF subfamily)
LGFLHAVVEDPAGADEVFSLVCEKAWTGLPRFRFESTFRTWLYSVARNVARDRHRARRRDRNRYEGLEDNSRAGQLAAQVRSSTAIHLRTQTKTELQRMRDALPPDDRVLLVLRLDREMSWTEVAKVLDGDTVTPAEVAREAARLRKRYERVKAKLAAQLRAFVDDPS